MRSLPILALLGCTSYKAPPSSPDDAPVDAVPDMEVCTAPPVTCFDEGGGTEPIGCTLQPVASCDSELVRYCDCGAAATHGAIMLFPNADDVNKTDIVYTSLAGLGQVSMSFQLDTAGVLCVGVAQASCDIDAVACGGGNTALRRWTVSGGAGSYKISVYKDAQTSPCNTADQIAKFTATR